MVRVEPAEQQGRVKIYVDDETIMGNYAELVIDDEDGQNLLRQLVAHYMGDDVAKTLDPGQRRAPAARPRRPWWAFLFGDRNEF